MEVYDNGETADAQLTNLSTRGFVQAGDRDEQLGVSPQDWYAGKVELAKTGVSKFTLQAVTMLLRTAPFSPENVFSTIGFGYDDASQVRWEQSNVTGANGPAQVNYLRYPSGEVAHIQYPNGTWIRRNYTARGQLKDVGLGSSGSTSYVYLPDGRVDYQARLNGVTTNYGYDGRGLISSVRHRKDGTAGDLTKRDYWRDNRDRIVAWEKGFNLNVNPRENGRGDHYQYDAAGQLTQAAYQAENAHDTAGTAERTDAFQYDEMGNRTGANWVASRGLMKFAGRNNKLNQYGSWENNIAWPDPLHWGLMLWYDDAAPEPAQAPWLPPGNGVLMGDGWNVAGFNALNQPVQMTSFFYKGTGNWMWFGYDPLGRCVKRWVGPADGSAPNGATYLYYDGWNLIQEGLSANSVARTYVHGARVDEIVASATGGGSWLYHQYDARGHCIMLTNTSGGIQEQYEYDAFGQPYIYDANSTLVARNVGSPVGNRFLFTGREWLKEVRVYDYRARLYQPELGRFLQPDPKQFEAGDYNLYRYCHNDPVNKVDPTGLDTYSQNRDLEILGGGVAYLSNVSNPTHTFVFTTNPDGSVAHTYSWGNTESVRGWNLDSKLDKKAADIARKMPSLFQSKVGDSKLDPYIQKAYEALNKKENEHANGGVTNNCKTEANKLIEKAKELQKADEQTRKKVDPPKVSGK